MSKKQSKPKPLLPADLDDFVSKLEPDSDRGAALVGAALLDAQLENLLRHRLKHHQDSLLHFSGALGAFAVRINVARALDLIDADVETDLHLMRDIRNRMAHSFDRELGFTSPEISKPCLELRIMSTFVDAFDEAKPRLNNNLSLGIIDAWRDLFFQPRRRFLMAAHFIAQHLKQVTDSPGAKLDLGADVAQLGRNFRVEMRGSGSASG